MSSEAPAYHFKFDVHSFIFSDNAVGLENKLHTILNDKRKQGEYA